MCVSVFFLSTTNLFNVWTKENKSDKWWGVPLVGEFKIGIKKTRQLFIKKNKTEPFYKKKIIPVKKFFFFCV